MKKCFLLCEVLLIVSLLSGCEDQPVHIADEIDVDELWSLSENENSTEETDFSDTGVGTGEHLPAGGIVFYTESGSVWHATPECSSLSHSNDIVSGTVEQAVSAGMKRACKNCS